MIKTIQKKIKKISVIGSGQIGPDIALYFSKVLQEKGVAVVVVDIAPKALEQGKKKIQDKLTKGVETKAFKPEQAEAILGNILFTTDYCQIQNSDFVLEAATEDLPIKHKIWKQVEALCARDTLFASNSSHLEPEVIFEALTHKERALCIHYFFPAERNIVVEVIPSSETAKEVTSFLLHFYESIGKVPILVQSRYGYAVDPVFEGLFQIAVLLVVEKKLGTKEVDSVAQQVLGLGVGPFTAMNLTGGNPITAKGLAEYHHKINPWFHPPKLLSDQMASGKAWETPSRKEKIEIPDPLFQELAEEFQGGYFALVTEILEAQLVDLGHLEIAIENALVLKAPFAWMNQLGIQKSEELIRRFCQKHPQFPLPKVVQKQAQSGKPWKIPYIFREDREGVAILTFKRPKVLNALNEEVLAQLQEQVHSILENPQIHGAILTGFGVKAFISGADIHELAALPTKSACEQHSLKTQSVLNQIEDSPKPFVAALNGLALGGGSELAMACHARIGIRGLSICMGQPEPNLGIIPGAGGTQRLPRLIGVAPAWKILRSAQSISSEKALALGYLQELVEHSPVEQALEWFRTKRAFPRLSPQPLEIPETLPEVELGHLSKKTDALLQKAILEGLIRPLKEGLKWESHCFGECRETHDMQIGMSNFIQNGPRVPANFQHQ
jgi:enoyl-CoA hydratase/3-hydroxyacyl-CoA dehydrogenase